MTCIDSKPMNCQCGCSSDRGGERYPHSYARSGMHRVGVALHRTGHRKVDALGPPGRKRYRGHPYALSGKVNVDSIDHHCVSIAGHPWAAGLRMARQRAPRKPVGVKGVRPGKILALREMHGASAPRYAKVELNTKTILGLL